MDTARGERRKAKGKMVLYLLCINLFYSKKVVPLQRKGFTNEYQLKHRYNYEKTFYTPPCIPLRPQYLGRGVPIGKLTFETISNTEVILVNADRSITSVYLSSTITYQGKTYRVTSIGESAFDSCKSLKSVIVPSHTKIGDYAFPSQTQIIRK